MAEHYFIDAYNVMHKSSLLRPVAAENLERAREMLLDKVVCFCMSGSKEVTVVFDGRQEEQSLSVQAVNGHVAGMQIIFSPANTSADSVIERLIYQQRNRMQCIVVSNDGGLRSLCRGMGALTMEADSFLTSVRQFQQSAKAVIEKQKDTHATLLEDRLNPESMRALEALRSKLPDKKKKQRK
jgi:predicted RNA-binding protein with PIN domain